MAGAFDKWSPSIAQVILFAAGGLLVFIGQEFGLPVATAGGVLVLGALMVVVGVDLIVKKLGVFRSEAWGEHQVVDAYRAMADLLWALVFIVGGLGAAAVVLVEWFIPATPDTFWADLLNNSTVIGAILGFVGLMILLEGLIRALVGSGRVDPRRFGGLAGAFDRLVGALTFVVGLAMAAMGLVLLVAPGSVTSTLEQLKNQLVGN